MYLSRLNSNTTTNLFNDEILWVWQYLIYYVFQRIAIGSCRVGHALCDDKDNSNDGDNDEDGDTVVWFCWMDRQLDRWT